ncbi:MAG: DUF2157 domain-containing protein [Hyphomicrobiaceae bacterium]|nr:DUF2157 domain-containing protein [Hyphomicrobiaceae bacterium]
MFMSSGRLRAEMARWQEQGWVTSEGVRSIQADLDSRRSGFGLAGTLATLGAVLMGFAAMSFVAANWQDMSKLLRLLILFGGLAGSYGLAYALFQRKLDVFGHAAVLTGVALFGASIMLIAQMYHMEGNPPDAVWLWAIGALVAGLLLKSNPALGAALILICIWSWMSMGQRLFGIHWGFLPMWGLAAAGIAMTRWRRGLDLLAMSFSSWLVMAALQYGNERGGYILAVIGVGLALFSILQGDVIDRWRRISGTLLSYGMVLAYIGLFVVQFVPRGLLYGGSSQAIWLPAIVTLGLIVGALWWAWRTENRSALWIAYVAFSVEIFALYLRKVGSLMGTSLFFFITGLLVIALSVVAYRLHNTRVSTVGGQS